MKISKKLLGISGLLVVVALIITSVSIVNFRGNRIDTGVKQQESAEVLIKQEDVSKREANVKHFLNEDGSYTAVTYDSPIHYKNGDVWEEIDNSLIVSSEYFENADNPFKVQLPSQIDSDSPVTVSFGDYKLSFCFEGIQSASAE